MGVTWRAAMSGKQILLAAGFVLALFAGARRSNGSSNHQGLCVPDQAGAASSGVPDGDCHHQ